MKAMQILFRRILVSVNIALLAAAAMALCGQVRADTTNAAPGTASAEADQAWKEVAKALIPPAPPGEWQITQPTREQVDAFQAERARLAGVAADKAKDFFTRFPNDPRAAEARQNHYQLLQFAVLAGNTNKVAELREFQKERAKDPTLSAEERVALRLQIIDRAAAAKSAEGRDAVMAEYEKGARELLKEFPKQDEPYEYLLLVARNSDDKKARALAAEIVAGAEAPVLKGTAQQLLRELDVLGKPLAIKFTAIDGRKVDLGKTSAKVVLVDFWATWCPVCVEKLPEVKQIYENLHAKGFDVVGINLDGDKDKLTSFVARAEMKWPQYFDTGGALANQFGIEALPAMWLVDKKGVVRDINARVDLEHKVEKLLAE